MLPRYRFSSISVTLDWEHVFEVSLLILIVIACITVQFQSGQTVLLLDETKLEDALPKLT